METSEVEVQVMGGLVRTRTGRLVPVREFYGGAGAPGPEPSEERSSRWTLSVGLALFVVIGLLSYSLFKGDGRDAEVQRRTTHADFGHVIREIRGHGIER